MKSSLQREFIHNSRIIFPQSMGRFTQLCKVQQPKKLWYCEAPFSDTPTVQLVPTSVVNQVVSRQRGYAFKFQEGLLIPETQEDDQLDLLWNNKRIVNKVYLGNIGEFGCALFARVFLPKGFDLGYYSGKVITKDYQAWCEQTKNFSCLAHTVSLVKDSGQYPETQLYTSEQFGGILGFAQSAPQENVKQFREPHQTENITTELVQVGKYVFMRFKLKRAVYPGEMLAWQYGEKYWQTQKKLNGGREGLFSHLGEYLGQPDQSSQIVKRDSHVLAAKYQRQAQSFYQCQQYDLAIRYWFEAFHCRKTWLKENAQVVNSAHFRLFLHPACKEFHENVANAYLKLNQIEKAKQHITACQIIDAENGNIPNVVSYNL